MMRTFITIICIVALLGLFIAGERIYVVGFCDELLNEISEVRNNLAYGDSVSGQVDSITKNWEKQKDNIFIFSNHNIFKEIETGIYNMQYSVKKGDKSDADFFANSVYHRIKELKEGTGFTVGNLL